jgi:hypothetical protein
MHVSASSQPRHSQAIALAAEHDGSDSTSMQVKGLLVSPVSESPVSESPVSESPEVVSLALVPLSSVLLPPVSSSGSRTQPNARASKTAT